MHLQITWENDDADPESDDYGEQHLSIHADVVPRVGEEMGISYKDNTKLPEITSVSGRVDSVYYEYDCCQPKPEADVYPRIFLTDVKTRKWTP